MLKSTKAAAQTEEKVEEVVDDKNIIPEFGTLEYIQHRSEEDGNLLAPIEVSITGSTMYQCPELQWFNYDVYPHKVKITNTGYTVLLGAKWKTERPYLIGGPFLDKHVLSQIHFHWGDDLMKGADHPIDTRRHPGEMHVTYFRSEYLTQEEAFKYPDGVVVVCYLIKYGVLDDARLSWVLEGFPRIKESKTNTRIGPLPMSHLLPMFYEDYFLYWGRLDTSKNESFCVRWLVPRTTLFATSDQMKEFRKLWDPWDEPLLQNFRPVQERGGRMVFLINPHWNLYNSLLPIPRVLPEPSISVLSSEYQTKPWMLPPQNADMLKKEEESQENETKAIEEEDVG